VRRITRWYGANPLHLLALLACFGLAGYAAAQLVPSRPVAVAVWFIGAVIGHDLVLMPLYSIADRSVLAAALLLLIWFPLILRLTTRYQQSTTLSPDPFLWHWLAVTGALFLMSAAAYALRLRAAHRAALPEKRRRRRRRSLPGLPPSGGVTLFSHDFLESADVILVADS